MVGKHQFTGSEVENIKTEVAFGPAGRGEIA